MNINFYIIGNDGDDSEDVKLGKPVILSSSDTYLDLGFRITDRDKIEINRLIEINDGENNE